MVSEIRAQCKESKGRLGYNTGSYKALGLAVQGLAFRLQGLGLRA